MTLNKLNPEENYSIRKQKHNQTWKDKESEEEPDSMKSKI